MNREELVKKKCRPIAQTEDALDEARVAQLHRLIMDWSIEDQTIRRRFLMKKYSVVLDFVAAIGALSVQECHHPVICFGYGFVEVRYTTHFSEWAQFE